MILVDLKRQFIQDNENHALKTKKTSGVNRNDNPEFEAVFAIFAVLIWKPLRRHLCQTVATFYKLKMKLVETENETSVKTKKTLTFFHDIQF